MSMKIGNSGGLTSILKDGYKHYQGVDEAVMKNIAACKQLAEITTSSFGPNGANKLVINHLNKLFLTNDAGTILREMEIAHPAAKLIVGASQQQDKEFGDGTNFVIVLAGELMQRAENLLRQGLNASAIVDGFELAYHKTIELLPSLSIGNITNVASEAALKPVIKSVIGSKQSGLEESLSELVLKAVMGIMPKKDIKSFNTDNIRCVKILGGSLAASHVLPGMVFNREPLSAIKSAKKAKIAVFACPIDISRTETKGTVLLKGAQEMLDFSKGEEKNMEASIKAIAEAGVKVVITKESVGDLALHFIDRYGMMALKVPSKFDLARLCKAIGATPSARLGAPMAEEAGFCDVIETVEIGGDRCIVFRLKCNNLY